MWGSFCFFCYIVALSSRSFLCWHVPRLFIALHAVSKHTLKEFATPRENLCASPFAGDDVLAHLLRYSLTDPHSRKERGTSSTTPVRGPPALCSLTQSRSSPRPPRLEVERTRPHPIYYGRCAKSWTVPDRRIDVWANQTHKSASLTGMDSPRFGGTTRRKGFSARTFHTGLQTRKRRGP